MDDFCFNCFIEKMSVLLYIENIDVIRVFLEILKKKSYIIDWLIILMKCNGDFYNVFVDYVYLWYGCGLMINFIFFIICLYNKENLWYKFGNFIFFKEKRLCII